MASRVDGRHMPLIRVELRGGLGNQLFQAAAGFSLARRLGGRLQFELTHYKTGALRSFAIDRFQHGAELIQTKRTPLQRLRRRIGKMLPGPFFKEGPGWHGRVLEERDYAYDPRILEITGDCYLRGYFQSWRYFEDCADTLRQAFDPATGASEQARSMADAYIGHTLAVHVRVGDFLQVSKANSVHGTLPAGYYRDALALARAARNISRVLVFSDNIDVARQLVPNGADVDFIEGFSAHDDLYLMSRAHSHIIANSTFSYWSAWLDGRTDPFVIAPRAWLSPEALKKTYIGDLYPQGWILL